MATNFLNFCRTGNAIYVAFPVGAPGVGCAAGEGRIYTWSVEGAIGSGLLVPWAVAVGFNSKGDDFEISSLGSSTASFPLPSLVSIGEVFLSSPMAHTLHIIVGHPAFPQELLLVPLSIPPEVAVGLFTQSSVSQALFLQIPLLLMNKLIGEL